MKVLHVTKKYPDALGGDATVVSNLEKQQSNEGNEVFILTTNCDDIIEKENLIKFGVKDTPTNLDKITLKRIISLIHLYFKSKKILRKIKPDIVHSHSVDMGYVLSKACRKLEIPVVHTCHGVTFNDKRFSFVKKILDKFLLKHSKFKLIITCDANSVKDFDKEKIKNTIYIPNGVNLLKAKRKSESKKLKFISVGRLEEQKGLIYLIESVREIVKENKDIEILLVGEGAKKDELLEKIKEYKLDNYFNFIGSKTNEEVMKLYTESDIFILSSVWEGLPIALLEAMSFGLPVVTTNVGGISKICSNNKNALIIPAKNTSALKEAMTSLIKDKSLRKKLGENARKTVEKNYNWDKISKLTHKIYEGVLR